MTTASTVPTFAALTDQGRPQTNCELPGIVPRSEITLEESKTWLAGSVSDPNQLSRALVALKGLAEHHQDQRIMELAWATANMLDRLTDGTLQVNDEFQVVVERSTRLLLIAYVFQTWTTEDEVEYAKTLEDADILASGGELKSLG